jgi:hypothetical protein
MDKEKEMPTVEEMKKPVRLIGTAGKAQSL